MKWAYEFEHYQMNIDGSSTLTYYRQSVEIDAYAFAIYLLNKDVERGERWSLETSSIPDEINREIIERAYEIASVMD